MCLLFDVVDPHKEDQYGSSKWLNQSLVLPQIWTVAWLHWRGLSYTVTIEKSIIVMVT